MNKPYFAKYLPVEGEIKEGDWVLSSHKDPNLGPWLYHLIGKEWEEYEEDCKWYPGKKAKLFLCSRDIQVGDKVQWCYGTMNFIEEQRTFLEEVDAFKVIGEISPKAIWVKEGDEFEEDQIRKSWLNKFAKKFSLNPYPVDAYIEMYQIKGQCGYFH